MRFALGDVVSIRASTFREYPPNLIHDGTVFVRIIAKHRRLPYYGVEVDPGHGNLWSNPNRDDWDILDNVDGKPLKHLVSIRGNWVDDPTSKLEISGSSAAANNFNPSTYVPFGKSNQDMEKFKLGDVIKIPVHNIVPRQQWFPFADKDGYIRTRIIGTKGTNEFLFEAPEKTYISLSERGAWKSPQQPKLLDLPDNVATFHYIGNLERVEAEPLKGCIPELFDPNFKYQIGETVWVDGHQATIVARGKSNHSESRYIVEKREGSFKDMVLPVAKGTILPHNVRKLGFWLWDSSTRHHSNSFGLGCADDNIQTKPPPMVQDQKKEHTAAMSSTKINIGDEISAKLDGKSFRAVVFGTTISGFIVEHPSGIRVTNPTWLHAQYAPGKTPKGELLLTIFKDEVTLVKDASRVVNIGDRVSCKIGSYHVSDAIVYGISKDRTRVVVGHNSHGNKFERTPTDEWNIADWYEESDFEWKYMLSMENVNLEQSAARKPPPKQSFPKVGDKYKNASGQVVTVAFLRENEEDVLCIYEPGVEAGWSMGDDWRHRNPEIKIPDQFTTGTYSAWFYSLSSLKEMTKVAGDSEKEEKVQVNEEKKTEGFMQMCKDDMEEAAYRGAARQITKGTRAILVTFLKSQGAKKAWIKTIVEMSESDWGCSMISWGLGVALTYAPHLRENAHCQILAKEFRVEGLGSAVSQVGDIFRAQFEPMILKAISNLPTPPAEKLRILEEEKKGRRVVDPTVNEVLAEQEAIANEAALKEQKSVAQATI